MGTIDVPVDDLSVALPRASAAAFLRGHSVFELAGKSGHRPGSVKGHRLGSVADHRTAPTSKAALDRPEPARAG